ncbi:pikachurin [Manduca sexta]|uniref:pikachurin n=1 Tax=Manduca sexta TaxID=7130 RepID=UPI00188ED6B0|nr:pikachurin [Manduca sexta]
MICGSGECAPTLAPWKPPSEVTTIETSQHHPDIQSHSIYDINDIVHFEDNDIVMRDAKNYQDHNKLENSIDPLGSYGASKIDSGLNVGDDDEKAGKREDKDACECQHGGGCVNKVCLCPLGYAGDKCEITLDLKVPRFNGSSYLRLPGLGNSALFWLDVQLVLFGNKFESVYASLKGPFKRLFSVHLRDYFLEFAFDLGSGVAIVRSSHQLRPNTWYSVSVSRWDRRATLRVRTQQAGGGGDAGGAWWWSRTWSRGAARSLSLRQPVLLGGAPRPLPPRLALHSSFSGCIGQLVINDEELSVVSSALGGLNVDNCAEPANHSCDGNLCKESIQPFPEYAQNLTENDVHHSIVAKKGIKSKYHKKMKKHAHAHTRTERKKFKYQHHNEVNARGTDSPHGRTYMQMKYANTNEINWGDTNTYPSFSGTDSFIHIDDDETVKRLVSYSLDINIRFRSVSPHGLVVWSGRSARAPPNDFLSLAVERGVLVFRYDLGSGEVVIIANHTRVDDGLWHRARATRNRQAGVLEVDGLGSVGKVSPGKHKQLNTENGLYIGGLPSIELTTMGKYKSGLVGCVSQISLSGDFDIPLSLSKLPHTITNNVGRCTP